MEKPVRYNTIMARKHGDVYMAFDFKNEYRELYQPGAKPGIIQVPPMKYLSLQGKGNPNEAGGEYQQAVGILYTLSYTLKMSGRSGRSIPGFFEYVVPPLEGFWRQDGIEGVDYGRKEDFIWISAIRLPEFIAQEDLDWAKQEAARKKGLDCSTARMLSMEEGLCVQMLHTGPYDDEPATVAAMTEYAAAQGYDEDFSDERLHHEIYLSDPRRTAPEKLRTLIRHPIRRKP